ncbi:hypothetical protein FO485_21025, partial [Bacillus amyloliquefaciens]|uniref:hypothetical protein n=1 Tax=Bacillus amyloliquefaciens TaxID=1390 RepID=UPI0028521EF6
FNEIIPESFPYMNVPSKSNIVEKTPERFFLDIGADVKAVSAEQPIYAPFKKGIRGKIIAQIFKRVHSTETSKMLDRMKNLGFRYSTIAGIAGGVSDIVVLDDKQEVLDEAQSKVYNIL